MKIGKLIAQRRHELKMTQGDLAKKLYVSTQAVSKWERDLSYPDITLISLLAKTLQVSLTDLLSGEISNQDNQENDERFSTIINLSTEKINKLKKRMLIAIISMGLILVSIVGYYMIDYYSKEHHGLTSEDFYSCMLIENIEDDIARISIISYLDQKRISEEGFGRNDQEKISYTIYSSNQIGEILQDLPYAESYDPRYGLDENEIKESCKVPEKFVLYQHQFTYRNIADYSDLDLVKEYYLKPSTVIIQKNKIAILTNEYGGFYTEETPIGKELSLDPELFILINNVVFIDSVSNTK